MTFLSKALSALLREHAGLVGYAKEIGDVAAHMWHHREDIRDIATGNRRFQYSIRFSCEEDLERFDNAIRGIVDTVLGDRT